MKNKVEIGLGTVHLGLPYGVNAQGPLMEKETVFSILSCAIQAGIQFFDTAAAYGEAESRLGDFGLLGKCGRMEIATKIPTTTADIYQNETRYLKFVKDSVQKSLQHLRVKSFALIQFHQCDLEFLEMSAIAKAADYLLSEGLAHSVGISVYDPEEALAALNIPAIESLQFPICLLNQKFANPKILKKIHTKRLIARSIFLQGLLVSSARLPASRQPQTLQRLKDRALAVAKEFETPLEDLALQYVFGEIEGISVALLGADSVETLKANLKAIENISEPTGKIGECFKLLAEEATLKGWNDPRCW